MSRKKKYVLAAVPVCIMAFSFAACGADTEEATVKAATAAASETSTAMTMTEKDTNAKIQALEKYKLAAENKDAEEETPYQRYWNGDWYGWGGFTNGTSLYAETDGIFFDCMARVSIDAGGEGNLILWNEKTKPLWPLAHVDVFVSGSGPDMGKLKSVSGWYMDNDLGVDDWIIAPDNIGYENIIRIEGTYVNPEDASSTYDYQFILRPWGLDWSDVEADYPDGLPFYYETWYLPAIGAGIPMPDVIGGGSFLAPGEVPNKGMEGQEG